MKLVFALPAMGGPVDIRWQKGTSSYVCIGGYRTQIHLYDRNGAPLEIVSLKSCCIGLEWSFDGTLLALLEERANFVTFWDTVTKKPKKHEFGIRDVALCMSYSRSTLTLAIGTAKGNLILIENEKVTPIVGKHSKKIVMVDWSTKDNLLATYSEDNRIIISNNTGDTMTVMEIRSLLTDLMFDQRFVYTEDSFPPAWRFVTGISSKGKTFFVCDHRASQPHPLELSFKTEYGNVTCYTRCNENLALLGFSNGQLIGMALGAEDGSDPQHFVEQFQLKDHVNAVTAVAVAPQSGRVACCGDNCVKIHSLTDFTQVINVVEVEEAHNNLKSLAWSAEEQLLCVGLQDGSVRVYLARLPVVGCSNGEISVYLSGVKEISVLFSDSPIPVRVQVPTEVSGLAMNQSHVTSANGNMAVYFAITPSGLDTLYETEFPARILKTYLGEDYAAVLLDNGKVKLHMIMSDEPEVERESTSFPKKPSDFITCCDLQAGFLVFGVQSGEIHCFFVEEWAFAYTFEHSCGISQLYLSPTGLLVCFVDETDVVYVLNMVTDVLLPVEMSDAVKRAKVIDVLWESWEENPDVFCLVDGEKNMSTCVVYYTTIRVPEIFLLCTTQLPRGYYPLHVHDGEVTCISNANRIAKVRLDSHSNLIPDISGLTPEQLKKALEQSISLHRLRDAWEIACMIRQPFAFQRLANVGMNLLEIEFAIRCHRELKDSAFVQSLEELLKVEDCNLLSGLVLVLLNEPDRAEQMLLKSVQPLEALQLRRDLLQWEQALQLAKNLAPEEIPLISKEYAQDLETSGDYGNAMYHYERGVTKKPELREHDDACRSGIARTAMRLGEMKKGTALALELGHPSLLKECAAILDGLKLYSDAATLYEKAESWEKAVALYLKTKMWQKATDLLDKCSSAKLQLQYAKAMEANGQYKLAAGAYVQCKEFVSAIKLYLDKLKNPEAAVNLVSQAESPEAARLVANFFLGMNDYGTAIQFLIASKCTERAFELAKQHHQMEEFADAIGDEGTQEEYVGIAKYFDSQRDFLQSGKFWTLAEEYRKAVAQYLKVTGDDNQATAVEGAIAAVTRSKDDALVQTVVDFLIGDSDGEPKDAKHLFRLYICLKHYRQAARTATIIAREDQNSGNYRVAHDMLFRMITELKTNGIDPPGELFDELCLLHSYIIAKQHVKRADHTHASRLLQRAAANISKFPMHTVPILTSTVVEAHRGGRRLTAFNIAKGLMKPEYRSKIDAKYKDKIERMIRRPDKTEIEEPTSPCPYCDAEVEIMCLHCPECKSVLPFCIISGQHMEKGDWSECPSCCFPALYSKFTAFFGDGNGTALCPMCSEDIPLDGVVHVTDPTENLGEFRMSS